MNMPEFNLIVRACDAYDLSPDGTQIVYAPTRDPSTASLEVIPLDGGQHKRIFQFEASANYDGEPIFVNQVKWSPSGSTIAASIYTHEAHEGVVVRVVLVPADPGGDTESGWLGDLPSVESIHWIDENRLLVDQGSSQPEESRLTLIDLNGWPDQDVVAYQKHGRDVDVFQAGLRLKKEY